MSWWIHQYRIYKYWGLNVFLRLNSTMRKTYIVINAKYWWHYSNDAGVKCLITFFHWFAEPSLWWSRRERSQVWLITTHRVPVSGPCFPSCTIQRNIFINYFVNASFLVALETFLKRRESHLIPFFKCKCFFLRGEIICWLFIFWYNQKIVGYWIREALIVLGVSLTFHRWG